MGRFMIDRPATAFALDPSSKHTKRLTDDRHLAFIRRLPSVISGTFGCEACHIRYGNPLYKKIHTGIGRKPDDGWTVPLTPDEHRSQHSGNEREFWLSQGIDPLAVASALYEISGDEDAGRRIILQARSHKL